MLKLCKGELLQANNLALFTYSGRFSTRREAADGAAGDKSMASAIAEEHDGSDGAFLAVENWSNM